MKALLFLLFASFSLLAAPLEEARKYHELLLKNAQNETLMTRFLEAWLDEQDREALEKWLAAEAESGAPQQRVWARYLEKIGARDRSLIQYQRALQLEPTHAETGLAVARLQAAALDFEGALTTLGERGDVEAVTLRGAYEHRLGKTEKALELWRGLLEKKPKDRELREDLVKVLRQEGLGKEARELQKELIALGDDPYQGALDRIDLGDLELEEGLKEAALSSYREVLAAAGNGSWLERESLHKIHEVFRRERDAEGLRTFLAKLRETMPHRLALKKSFARQLVVTGEVDEGTAAFRELLRRVPGDDSLRLEFVELLAFAKRHEEAAEEMAVLIAREATAERWVRLAELRQEFAEEEVLATLAKVEALKNGEPVGLLELARIYARFDRDEEALRVLKKGHREHPDSRELSEALAVLLVELGEKEEALKIWLAMTENGGIDQVLRVAQSLQRHGLAEKAFALLEDHREQLEGSFAGLRLYTELALATEKFEAAWSGARHLITLPEAYSDLQVAVNLGSVIARRYGHEKAIAELKDSNEENALCLLANLYQEAGNLPKADAAILRVEGELGQRHRVALLTSRGDLAAAITHLRTLIGKRISLPQRRQLIDLLERQRDHAGALKEVEAWKISSPGEVRAWRKRATLLARLGRQAEAADELRRARNQFGKDDVDLTRELAKMQIPLGRHREALRLYDHLFRTAPTDEARLKFLEEMYAAASQAGLGPQVISRFEKEHAKARRELYPLRVLAGLYELSHNHGARQEVLLKQYRLQPKDEKVLFELVALAEQNNDPAGAQQLLLEHASRTESAGTLQRLAAMQIRAGEVEAGLEILNRIAPGELSAGDVEATALTLWNLGEHQLVLDFLEESEAMVSADWRLKAMRSDFLAAVGRVEEAKKIWIKLLGVEGALGRPFPPNYRASGYFSVLGGGRMNQWTWWQLMGSDFSERQVAGNRSTTPVSIPGSVEQVRWWSLVRLGQRNLAEDPSGESWRPFLETVNHPWLADVREWGLFQKVPAPALVQNVPKGEVEETAEVRLRKMIEAPETSREEFLEVAAELEAEELKTIALIHAAFKLPEGEAKLAELRAVVERIAKEPQGGSRSVLQFTRLVGLQGNFAVSPQANESQPSPPQREMLRLLEPWWQQGIESAIEGKLARAQGFLFPLGIQRVSGDLEGFFENLDRLVNINLATHPTWTQVAFKRPRYQRPLEGLPERSTLLYHLATRHVIYSSVHQLNSSKIISPELLAEAREGGWKFEGNEVLEEFAEGIPKVKDGILRALLYHKIGLERETLAEMEKLAAKGSFEDKLDLLAFRHTSQEGWKKELLLALLAMDRDGLNASELRLLDGVTLGEARKHQRLNRWDDDQKFALGEILKRFAQTPMGRTNASTLRGLYQPLGLAEPVQKIRPRSRQRQSYRQLLAGRNGEHPTRKESAQERNERSFFEQLKRSFSSPHAVAYLQQLVTRDIFLRLEEKALALYEPGDSRSYLKQLRYAQLCLAYDKREEAREVLLRLEAQRPYDESLGSLLLRAQSDEEQAAALDELLRTGNISNAITTLNSVIGETNEEEIFFKSYERLLGLLESRADDFTEQDRDLIFQTFQGLQNQTKIFEKRSIRSMNSPLPKVEKGTDSKEGDWAARTRQRKIIIDAFGEMMRFRSLRKQALTFLKNSQEALRLSNGNVEWIVFDALEKEPVIEKAEKAHAGILRQYSRHYGSSGNLINLALAAVMDSEKFSEESVDQLVHHVFLTERQGAFLKASLTGETDKMESLLAADLEEATTHTLAQFQHLHEQPQWKNFLETLLRSDRWEAPVRETIEEAIANFKNEQELIQMNLLRVCELGTLAESLAALEDLANTHLPKAAMHESYQKLKTAGAIPREIEQKIVTAQTLFQSMQNLPRAWIPLLTFLEKSERAVWVTIDEKKIRGDLQRRLDVMYKTVFYDRLRADGFSTYDGLALLGAERVMPSGEISSWLEVLISPLKLAPTEGRTYWINVSEDCREQVEEITYLEAFIAMRKDFKIDDETRREVLRQVLESERDKLSKLGEDQLRGLANLVKRDFPELTVTEASEGLAKLLKRLRNFPEEGLVERIERMMSGAKGLARLDDEMAKGLCARLAKEGEVEMAAEFWVAYLKTKAGDGNGRNFSSLNFHLLGRPPFDKALDLLDSIRFVRLVRTALKEQPELSKSITYTRDMLEWREAFAPFSQYKKDPAELIPHLDKLLQREGVTEADKRVMGGFLIKANLSGHTKETLEKVFLLRLQKSSLAGHSPGIVETLSALSRLEGTRNEATDAKALEVIHDYVQDPDLMPDFRADLAEQLIGKFKNDTPLRALANAEPVGVALRDLLLRGSYGITGNLHTAGPMLHFINEHLDTVPAELQREIYEAWTAALRENAGKVLGEKVGPNRKWYLIDLIFDFTGGGKRFPLPQQLIAELPLRFSGDLDLMHKLIRSGNDELVATLFPDAEGRFRLRAREYSASTQTLEKDLLPRLSEQDQLRLKCYLASLRDENTWKSQEENAGSLQGDRGLAAAKLFATNPPAEQALRLRCLDLLKYSDEALGVLVPLFDDQLKNDLSAVAQNHRGNLHYMLRWLSSGGAKTIEAFAPVANRPMRISGIRYYHEDLAELEKLLAPVLSDLEKMQLTCNLAVLADPRAKDGEQEEIAIPTRAERMKKAARYLLENPLPQGDREGEKKCVAQLVGAGLAEAETQALMQRHSGKIETLDAAKFAGMISAESELLAVQLRAALDEGKIQPAMNTLRILADVEAEIPKRQREKLINNLLPKIALPMVAHAARQEGGELMTALKELGETLFSLSFNQRTSAGMTGKRAVLFFTFATHCLQEDKAGFEALQNAVPKESRGVFTLFERPRRRSYLGAEADKITFPVSQPIHFDQKKFLSEKLKPLRKLLFTKISAQSFTGLLPGTGERSMITLMKSLHLTLAEVDLGEEVFASERGNFNLIATAITEGNDDLFLALLPTANEAYTQRVPKPGGGHHYPYLHRASRMMSGLGDFWARNPCTEKLDLIEDKFQRMHLEIYVQSVLRPRVTRGVIYDLENLDTKTEDEILKLLPKAGPAREQILARLGRSVTPGSPLAQALVAQAKTASLAVGKNPDGPDTEAQNEAFNTFVFGWIFALHSGDWSLLDHQFRAKADEPVTAFLTRCALTQALHQVAEEAGRSEEVLKKLAGYGIDPTNPNLRAWSEMLGLLSGAKKSDWIEEWQTLEADQKELAKAEMTAGLADILKSLAKVEPPKQLSFASRQSSRSDLTKIWMHPLARGQSARLLAAVMDDRLGLFSAVGISPKERASLLLKSFAWQQMKTCLESRFEGDEKLELLTELALEGQPLAASRDDFQLFIARLAPRVEQGSTAASQLWRKVAYQFISAKNWEGANAAREKIDPAHLKKHEFDEMDRQIEYLKTKAK